MSHIYLYWYLQNQLLCVSRWHWCTMVAICKAKKVPQRNSYSWTASDSWRQSAGTPHLCHFCYSVHCEWGQAEISVLCACDPKWDGKPLWPWYCLPIAASSSKTGRGFSDEWVFFDAIVHSAPCAFWDNFHLGCYCHLLITHFSLS